MATDDTLPHNLVQRFIAAVPANPGIASVALLHMLAGSLGNVIGADGFASLLSRSMRRAGEHHSWLLHDSIADPCDPPLGNLRQAFEGQDAAEARAASLLLLTTLVDTLSVLVGVHLTTLLLNSALASARAGLEEQGTAR